MIGTARQQIDRDGVNSHNEVLMTSENIESQVPVQEAAQAAPVPMVPATELERIKRETAQKSFQIGYEKGKNETVPAMAQMAASSVDSANQNTAPSSQVADPIRQAIADEFSRQANQQREAQLQAQQAAEQAQREEYAKQVLTEIHQKAEAAKQEIPDFDDVTKKIDFGQLPDILAMANTVLNGGHVLYDLAKNPSKIGALRGLPTSIAVQEIKRLSDSLMQNANSANIKMPQDPLSQLQTSMAGVGSGEPSLRDLKKKYRI